MPLKDAEAKRAYHKEYARKHYQENKDVYKKRARKWGDERRKDLFEYLNNLKKAPCADCKVPYPPYVMDFDHRDGGKTKLRNLSVLARRATSFEVIEAEVAKCDVVCANCHREREFKRQWSKSRKGSCAQVANR